MYIRINFKAPYNVWESAAYVINVEPSIVAFLPAKKLVHARAPGTSIPQQNVHNKINFFIKYVLGIYQ